MYVPMSMQNVVPAGSRVSLHHASGFLFFPSVLYIGYFLAMRQHSFVSAYKRLSTWCQRAREVEFTRWGVRAPSAKKLKIAVEQEAQTMLYNGECACV